MKRLLGLGGVIILGVLAALVASADAGDAIYVTAEESALLDTAAKRTAIRDVARELAPGLPLAGVDEIRCSQVSRVAPLVLEVAAWRCAGDRFDTPADGDLLDSVLSGKEIRARNGDTTTRLGAKKVEGATPLGKIDTFTEAAFGVDIALVAMFQCTRQDAGPPLCVFRRIKSASPAIWRSDFEAGRVFGTIGKVE